ncbi:MAG TPA: YggS family pyridoxal phosphate-dependent enzyme [Bacteroidota bacterium]
METISDNIRAVRQRIDDACRRAGRNPNEVTLIAVTKAFDSTRITEAVREGVCDIGENFVQELLGKREQVLDGNIRWHFIGHVQTNKVKSLVEVVHLIHSVDSYRVAEEVEKRASKVGRTVDVLLEVKTTGEATKYGVPPEEAKALVKKIAPFEHVRIRGLMTIGPFSPDPEESRPCFRKLRELSENIAAQSIENVEMTHLSMGMTNDFEVAVEEGATLVRLGTALFGPRSAG